MGGERAGGVTEYDAYIAQLARRAVEMGLGPLAIVILEGLRPLTFVGASLMVFMEPFAEVFVPPERYRRFVELLEDRRNVERLIEHIERLQDERG